MKTREEWGAAYYNSMRRFDLGIFFLCETDRKDNNGMKLIDAMENDVMKKRQGGVRRWLRRDQLQREGEWRGETRQRLTERQDWCRRGERRRGEQCYGG